MPGTNREKCKRYREKNLEKCREHEASRKRKQREKIRENQAAHNEYKARDRERKRLKSGSSKLTVKIVPPVPSTSKDTNDIFVPPRISPFTTKQAMSRSVKQAKDALPKHPMQKTFVLSKVINSLSPSKKNQVFVDLRWKSGPQSAGRPLILTVEKKQFLEEFLEREDVSYTMPGRKDQIYIGKSVDGESLYKSRHYLLWNLNELLQILNRNSKPESPDANKTFIETFGHEIKFSTMYRFIKTLRHIKFESQIPQLSCLCEYCENLELLVEGIKSSVPVLNGLFPTSCKDILSLFTCDIRNQCCAYGHCSACPSVELSELESTSDVSFYEWKIQSGKKFPEKIASVLSGVDCIRKLTDLVTVTKIHYFRKCRQHHELNELKSNLKTNEILIHVDFSENYSNQQQNAIQSAYFGQESFSLYTINVYYRADNDTETKSSSFVLVSSQLEHSRSIAYNLNKFILDLFSSRKDFDTVHFWSDGCAAQFKSKYCFYLLTKYDTSLKIFWHFFESHHGKGAVDGIGGCVKNVVYRKVLSKKVVMTSAKQFAEYANDVVKGIEVIFFDTADIADPCDSADVLAVQGTRKVRCVERSIYNDTCHLDFYTVTPLTDHLDPFISADYPCKTDNDCENATMEQSHTGLEPQPLFEMMGPIEPGKWYVVHLSEFEYWYVGIVTNLVSTATVKIDFLQQTTMAINCFKHETELSDAKVSDIFYKLTSEPTPVSQSRSNKLKLCDQDFRKITQLFEEMY